jgi:hypothetical protein
VSTPNILASNQERSTAILQNWSQIGVFQSTGFLCKSQQVSALNIEDGSLIGGVKGSVFYKKKYNLKF